MRSCFAPNLAFAQAELRRMNDEPSIVPEGAESFGQQT